MGISRKISSDSVNHASGGEYLVSSNESSLDVDQAAGGSTGMRRSSDVLTGPHRTEAERQADKETADRVLAALSADQELYSRHINVHANSGVVRLSGYVWTQPDLEEAKRVAESVQGVSRVVDDLELEQQWWLWR